MNPLRTTLMACLWVLGMFLSNLPAAQAQEADLAGLSEKEMETASQEMVMRGRMAFKSIVALEQTKRAEGAEGGVLACLKEKITGIKALLRGMERAQKKLADAQGQYRQGLFRTVVIADQRITSLQAEAQDCSQEVAQFISGTTVQVSVDEDIRTDDPTTQDPARAFLDDLAVPERLVEASPIL